MNIIVDADACPGIKLIEEVAKDFLINLILYSDTNHIIESDYATVIIVDQGFQSVDMHISNNVTNDDIVITQDYGLALIALTKGAKALHPTGMIYDDHNIENLLLQRYIASQSRKRGLRSSGPKKRTNLDDELLVGNLIKLIS